MPCRDLVPIAFLALALMAGEKLTKWPLAPLAGVPGRYSPRSRSFTCSDVPRRFASLQNTIFVLSGCNSSDRAVQACISSMTRSVILETVSFDTDAP